MTELHHLQTNMNSGELDPRVKVRRDITHYFNGLEYARNVTLLPQGGAKRRPGMEYLDDLQPQLSEIDLTAGSVTVTAPNGGTAGNAIDGDESTEVITSAAGTTDPFVIVHVDLGASFAVKFFDARQLRLTTGGTTSDNEVRCQYSTDNSSWSDFGTLGNPVREVGSTQINRRFSNTADVTAQYWRLVRVGSTDLTTDTFRVGEIHMFRGSAGLSEARCIDFKFSTVQNYMLIATDRNIAVYREGALQSNISIPHTSGQLDKINWVQSLDNLFIFHEDVEVWNVERQGDHDEWDDEAQAFTNIPQFDFGAGAEDTWSSTRGWPRCGTFHEGRFYMGGAAQRPTTWWASKVDDLFNFDKGTGLDDEAIEATLDADGVASIFNLHSGRHLQILTSDQEIYLLPEADPITPGNVVRKRTTKVGSRGPGVRVAQVEGALLFLEKEGRGLREFLFTDLEQAYTADSVTLLASHLLGSPTEMALKRSQRDSEGDLIFLKNSDGSLAVMQTMRSQDITGWSRWDTEGSVVAIGVDNDDDVYVAVERTINGATVRYIERFNDEFYTDAGLQFSAGLPTNVFAVAHLDGEVVQIRTDKAVQATKTVSGGSVTADDEAEDLAEIGLAFPDVKEKEVTRLIAEGFTDREARLIVFQGKGSATGDGDGVWIRDMPIGVDLPNGSTVGEMKSVVEATISVYETQGIYAGANSRPAKVVTGFRKYGDGLLDEPAPLTTAEIRITSFLGADTLGQVEITQRDPVPMTILGIKKVVDA